MRMTKGAWHGERLSDFIATRGALELSQAVDIVAAIAAQLSKLHEQAITHGRVASQNVMIEINDDGHLDAFLMPSPHSETFPAFCAPETIASANNRGPSIDVWGLGMILSHCLTGKLPFKSMHIGSVFRSIRLDDLVPIHSRAPHLPSEIIDVATTALTQDRLVRFSNAEQFGVALASAACGVRDLESDMSGVHCVDTDEEPTARYLLA